MQSRERVQEVVLVEEEDDDVLHTNYEGVNVDKAEEEVPRWKQRPYPRSGYKAVSWPYIRAGSSIFGILQAATAQANTSSRLSQGSELGR